VPPFIPGVGRLGWGLGAGDYFSDYYYYYFYLLLGSVSLAAGASPGGQGVLLGAGDCGLARTALWVLGHCGLAGAFIFRR